MLVAVTVTDFVAVTRGAVNRPELKTVPLLADQNTAVLDVFCTVAVNCSLAPEANVPLSGNTPTFTGAPGFDEFERPDTVISSRFLPWSRRRRSPTTTVKSNVPLLLGVPEMVPVPGPSDRPWGSAPVPTEK